MKLHKDTSSFFELSITIPSLFLGEGFRVFVYHSDSFSVTFIDHVAVPKISNKTFCQEPMKSRCDGRYSCRCLLVKSDAS